MPESPEVQALADELDAELRGRAVAEVDVVEFRVQKTRARPLETLIGRRVAAVRRRGKLIDVAVDGGSHLVVTLGRHGWARWVVENGDPDAAGAADPGAANAGAADPGAAGTGAADPGAASSGAAGTGAAGTVAAGPGSAGADAAPPPALAAIRFDDDRTLELTDAGGWVSLGAWVVDDPAQVPAVAKLGPDPGDASFARADFDRAFRGRRKQVKAVLQEQESLAGIGNAYSDEILFAARLSPVVHAAALDGDALDRLYEATVGVIRSAIEARRGIPIAELKAAKVAAMRVHGRAGEPCPGECGGTIRDFTFGSTTAQYCPDCQTGGELLPLKLE
ncbi:DNA-formamidopyrimidine glycosylase family protein [Agromyces arachidis]|uniref:DNA-formamidopyrimidine glycosylase family protein n=1 Tax=Agromyces arachidis TaxID=766966 RepID=UPI0040560F79